LPQFVTVTTLLLLLLLLLLLSPHERTAFTS
jgi:hypothetical protein